jgi:cephalosporin hydroxylase
MLLRKKLNLNKYDSDKTHYMRWYDPLFKSIACKKITLLEIGILKGGSLLMWKDYFKKASIVGIDLTLPIDLQPDKRIRMFKGDQTDIEFLRQVALETAPDGFDIIIDDASHMGELTKRSFWYLFDNHLKHGGIYAIEDWPTGYFEDWPDGKALDFDSYKKDTVEITKIPFPNHSYGMVGFVKQLVDEQAAGDVTKFSKPRRYSKFDNIIFTPAIVFVKKAL